MNNVCKLWDKEEDNNLLEEINKLYDIKKISEIHKRSEGGIRARIKKFIDNEEYSKKIEDKTEVLKKYFTGDNIDDYKNLVTNIKN